MHKRIAINSSSNHLLYISSSKIEYGFLPTLHSHPNLEVLLITEGSGTIITTNRRLPVQQHDIIIINANAKHCESGDGLRFYAIGVRDTEVFSKDTYTKKILIQELSSYNYTSILSMYNMIYDEARRNEIGSDNIINSAYDILFSILQRSYKVIENNTEESKETDLVSSIKAIIDTYYHAEIKLDELAHRLTQSKSNICHQFKEETGQSIIDYKITKEIDEACNLLRISDMSISDIALQVGFNNTSYFTKTFKERLNTTPKKYRLDHQNKA